MDFFTQRIKQFQKGHHRSNKLLYEQLKHGQDPRILLVTCSDSRVLPSQLLQSKPGEVFTIQNAGNIIDVAGIEYALTALNIEHIIICGHTHCGAMTGAMEPESIQSMPAVQTWLQHGPSKDKIADILDSDDDFESQLRKLIEENVLLQLEHIRSHPAYQALCQTKKVALHGWVYDFESGFVWSYNGESKEFEHLTNAQQASPDASFSLSVLGYLTCVTSFIIAFIAIAQLSAPLTLLSATLMLASVMLLCQDEELPSTPHNDDPYDFNYAC